MIYNDKEIEALLTRYPNRQNSVGSSPAIIVCTGGGYVVLGNSEGPPASQRFAANGFEVFLLNYCVGKENPFPTALRELAYTVKYIRANADRLNVDPAKVYVCGFSAGGHLAASLGIHWNSDWIKDFGIPSNARPDKLVLAYPVLGKSANLTSGVFDTLSANIKDRTILPYMYLNNFVTKDLPPTFIWHNQDDMLVPASSSIEFTGKLYEYGIPFESHIFPNGGHADPFSNDYWFYMAVDWLEQ